MVAALAEQAVANLVPPLELIDVVALIGESLAEMYGYRQLRPRADAATHARGESGRGARTRTKDAPLRFDDLLRIDIVGVKMVVLAHPSLAAAAGFVHHASFPLTLEQQLDWAEQRYIQWRLDVFGPAVQSAPANFRDLDLSTRAGMLSFQHREIRKHSFLQMNPSANLKAVREANALHCGGRVMEEADDPRLAAAYFRLLAEADVSLEDLAGISWPGELVMQPRALRKAFDRVIVQGVIDQDGRALSLGDRDQEDGGGAGGIELEDEVEPSLLAQLREVRDGRDGLLGHALLLDAWDSAGLGNDPAASQEAMTFLLRLRDTLDRQRDPALRAATVYCAFRPKGRVHGRLPRETVAAAYGVSVKSLRVREHEAQAALAGLAA